MFLTVKINKKIKKGWCDNTIFSLDVCSYFSKLWGTVSTPCYLEVIQSDKEKKQNKAQAKILQKEWWFVITTTIIFKWKQRSEGKIIPFKGVGNCNWSF